MAKDTNAPHEHPHAAIPVRIAKESGFAAPGLDVPAEQSRPARDAGTEEDHPVNRPLQDEDKSLIGPQLGRGGAETQTLTPVDPTCVYTDPGFAGEPDEKFVPGVDPALAKADAQFEDVSSPHHEGSWLLMTESKLDAARRKGDLTGAIGALRDQARAELAAEPASIREQVGLEDATIRVAAGLAGKSDVERRAALHRLRPGSTVSAKGDIAKTRLSKAEKLERVRAWAAPMSEDQREAFIVSEQFDKLSDRQQEIISEVFSEIADKAYSDSVGIADYDYDQESVDVEQLTANDDDVEDEVVDDSDSDFEAMFEQAAWEAEGTS